MAKRPRPFGSLVLFDVKEAPAFMQDLLREVETFLHKIPGIWVIDSAPSVRVSQLSGGSYKFMLHEPSDIFVRQRVGVAQPRIVRLYLRSPASTMELFEYDDGEFVVAQHPFTFAPHTPVLHDLAALIVRFLCNLKA